jgi:hypothetical protein
MKMSQNHQKSFFDGNVCFESRKFCRPLLEGSIWDDFLEVFSVDRNRKFLSMSTKMIQRDLLGNWIHCLGFFFYCLGLTFGVYVVFIL